MNTTKRILVLTSTFPFQEKASATPGFVKDLCHVLAQQGFTMDVVTPYIEGTKLYERFDNINVYRYHYFLPAMHTLAGPGGILANLKKSRFNYIQVPFFLLFQYIKAKQLIEQHEYDLIHAHWIIPQGWIALKLKSKLKLKTPILCTSHGGDLFALKGGFWQSVKTQVLKAVDHITVVSQFMRQTCQQLGIREQKISVISMGVDLTTLFFRMPYIKRQKHSMLFVGRLVEKKGLKYLIQAMPFILQQAPEMKLFIAGDGPLKQELEEEAVRLGCQHHIKFVGPQPPPALAHFYNKARLLVMPSIISSDGDQEGLGLVAVEAMGCKCPVVASELNAIKDTITDKKTGILCKPKNPKDIAEKVLWVLNNSEEVNQITQRAQAHVSEHFDIQTIGKQYAQIINRLINSGSASRDA